MHKALLFILAALLFAAPAQASFPGRNGKLAVTFQSCENQTYIRALSISGRDLGTVVPCERDSGDEPGRDVYGPSWSPDGTRLLFARGLSEYQQLATVAADGTGERVVPEWTPVPSDDFWGPSLSPSGRDLVVARGGSLYVGPVDGGNLRVLRAQAPCARGGGFCTAFRAPRWSPDGRTIAVARDGIHPGLWLIDASSGRILRRLARGLAGPPDWSPDARRIAFSTYYQQEE